MVGDSTTTTADTTLKAMLQQESVYHQYNGNSSSSAADTIIINRLVTCLENIQELCRLRHRETLVIATSYICRYHHHEVNLNHDDDNLERVALICFYMACKIHEPAALPLSSLTDLYQRFIVHNDDDISYCWERLELKVCAALQWRLNPPTSMSFVDQFLLLKEQRQHSDSGSGQRRLRKKVQACLDDAFRTDPYSYCSRYRPSSLAMAALKITTTTPMSFLTATSGEDLQRSAAFLRRVNTTKVPSPPSPTTAIAVSSYNKKNRTTNNKRCVTPPPPLPLPAEQQPRKKLKRYHRSSSSSSSSSSATTTNSNLSPCLISTRTSSCWQQQLPPTIPCLLWVGGGEVGSSSPRSALQSMAE